MTVIEPSPHILVVDDEAEIRDLLAAYFAKQGLRVTMAGSAAEARAVLAAEAVALSVLDVRMPGEDGLSLARFITEHVGSRIIMLSAAGEPIDRIIGMEIGADDYVAKPFHPRELLTRIRSVLERTAAPATKAETPVVDGAVTMGRCRLDPASDVLYGPDGQPLAVTPRELALLKVFADHAGQSLDRQRLMALVGADANTSARSIDVQITRLRRKIEADPLRPRAIRTVAGSGYVFIGDQTVIAPEPMEGPGDSTLPVTDAVSRAVIDAALDCVILMDEAGTLREFNPAAELVFGHCRDDVVGRQLGEVIVPPHLRETHTAGLARLLATGESRMVGRRIETQGMRADGSLFPLELAIVELVQGSNRLFAAYLRDLTERRNAEAEIQRQREALHQSEKMAAIGSLLAGVAHELNNPLSVVIGRAMMIEEEVQDTALAASAARLRQAAERCARIVGTFLAMARQGPAGERQPVDIAQLVDSALALMGYRLESSGITVERAIAAGLPAVRGDPDQLHQVILNLVVNAQQALMDAPMPRLLGIAAVAEGAMVRLEIADSGPGIPAGLRHRIFEPFFTTKPVGGGTGIGLSVCQGIVAGHGGSIELGERAGGGASFIVRLPRDEGPALPAEPDAAMPRSAGARVLVVDDEAEITLMLQEALQRDGHVVTTAGSGHEALAMLDGGRFDLVLADIRMAGMDGPDLYRAIAARDPALARRFMVMTGDTLGPALDRLPPAVRERRLEKPLDLVKLRRLLAESVG